jgi:hypothetical protein
VGGPVVTAVVAALGTKNRGSRLAAGMRLRFAAAPSRTPRGGATNPATCLCSRPEPPLASALSTHQERHAVNKRLRGHEGHDKRKDGMRTSDQRPDGEEHENDHPGH